MSSEIPIQGADLRPVSKTCPACDAVAVSDEDGQLRCPRHYSLCPVQTFVPDRWLDNSRIKDRIHRHAILEVDDVE